MALFAAAIFGLRSMTPLCATAISAVTASSATALRRAGPQSETSTGNARTSGNSRCCWRESPSPASDSAKTVTSQRSGGSAGISRAPISTSSTTDE